ncbi:MAG: hypothetical protein IAE83_00315, partial [Anaerolinea sp.]|nr:hypothetical protein [Anaerolinea sp.]
MIHHRSPSRAPYLYGEVMQLQAGSGQNEQWRDLGVRQGVEQVQILSCSLTLTLTESGKIVLGKTPKKGVKDFSYARW